MTEPAGAFAGEHVFITGATGGIGSVLAGKLAREGCRISALGHNKERLADLGEYVESLGGRCNPIDGDLTEFGIEERAVDLAERAFGPIDSAFLLAGSFPLGRLRKLPPKVVSDTISLNLASPISTIHQLTLRMASRDSGGKICAISSVAGLLPMPYLSVYSAAKSGLAMFCRSVAPELRDVGISLTCVAPRAVDTHFISELRPVYGRLGWAIDSPDSVANSVLRATALGKEFVILGGIERLGAALSWFSPRLIKRTLAGMRRIIGDLIDRKSDEKER